jgi:hypothetical protein
MQDGRDDGVGIEMQVREDLRRGERMGNIRLTRKALLAFVSLGAELRRLADSRDLLGGQVGFGAVDQLAQARQAPGTGQKLKERRRVVHGARALL